MVTSIVKETKKTYVDFTKALEDGMQVYPGEPEVNIEYRQTGQYATVAVSMSSHSGTSIDTPKHIIPEGKTLDDYPFDTWNSHGVIISFAEFGRRDVIEPEDFERVTAEIKDLLPGSFVFIHTGWDRHWGEDEYFNHPYVSKASCDWLAQQGVALVGIDAPNVDASWNNEDIAHTTLLENDVIVVENVYDLNSVMSDGRKVQELDDAWVIPLKLAKSDGAPARVFASLKK